MIVIYDRKNQLCNRIWSFVPLISYCIANNTKITILFFGECVHYFANVNIIKKHTFS